MAVTEAEERAIRREDRPTTRLLLAHRMKPARDRAVVRAFLRALGSLRFFCPFSCLRCSCIKIFLPPSFPASPAPRRSPAATAGDDRSPRRSPGCGPPASSGTPGANSSAGQLAARTWLEVVDAGEWVQAERPGGMVVLFNRLRSVTLTRVLSPTPSTSHSPPP